MFLFHFRVAVVWVTDSFVKPVTFVTLGADVLAASGFGGFTVYRLVRFDAECVSCACFQVLRSVRSIGV